MFQQLVKIIAGGGGAAARPSMDGVLEQMDSHLDNVERLIQPAPDSKPRTAFDVDLPKERLSMLNLSPRQRLKVLTKALPLFIHMRRAARLYDDAFQPLEYEASPDFLAGLEALAYRLGAKAVKYVKVPRQAIFRDKGIPAPYALVFTVVMDKEPLDTAPSFDCQHEVMRGYKNMAVIANRLADFMRDHGFAAYPGTALGGVTDYTQLAELAGLGAIGYHGLLISPGEGARLRINTVYTNITNLPLEKKNEHLWVRDFCAMCKKCIRSCPVEAIFDQPRPRGDGGRQCIDHDTCRDYFAANYGCGVCLVVCPFSQVGYEIVKARFKGNDQAPKFWIDLEPAHLT
ncbi:MAG: reductive dehalogenase domain-containing protein [Candidatus Promineifilaceae bacterium]|nr:reductive dehalogenase domain-containing protein [Candidatus Promineifilaceae bacterium]